MGKKYFVPILADTKYCIMATIKYLIRTGKKDKLANIYVRLKEGRIIDMTAKSGKFIHPEYWNNKPGTVRQKSEFSGKDDLLDELIKLRRHIEDSFQSVKDKATMPKDWLKITIDQHWHPEKYQEKKTNFFEFIDSFIEESKSRVNPYSGKKIAQSTLKKYGTCYHHLKQFAKREKKTIDFDDITIDFYNAFVSYMTEDCNLATNSIGKNIAILKGFMNVAVENGLTTNFDFKRRNFRILTEESDSIYLNEEELDKLWKFDLSEFPHLEKVRDYFLIGSWTGCRFQDWESINLANIKGNLLLYEQEKTGRRVTVPLHPVVLEILNKYDGQLPNKLQNQPFNRSIKEVCKLAEIDTEELKSITKGGKRETEKFKKWELVSSHTARRSLATNLYKSGFPAIGIMAITGHRTERSFLKYIKVSQEEHALMLQKHWKEREEEKVNQIEVK